jgi:alkylation response protein AidB-like acyl-CoA dehydrogenase
MANTGGDLGAFREEVRAWLEANYPASLHDDPEAVAADITEEPRSSPDRDLWKARMGAKGWGVPTWPTAYGGGGLSLAEAAVLAEEMDRIGAGNPIFGMGSWMFGPTLLEYGTEDQKRRHLPPIARGQLRWCQGYSEPGAGSDLASLQTKCEDAGDHWKVNGQKIWTSGAQYADWCFCLVRTDTTRKHEGISFVMINMRQPGVEPRPIRLIAGSSPFCETFFTDARVEKDDMLGPLNGGWAIAKRLLQFERAGQGGGRAREAGRSIADLARTYVGLGEDGRLADRDLRRRVTEYTMNARAHGLTARRAAAEAKGNVNPGATTSIMKNSATRLSQERAELALEIMGHQGLGWSGEAFAAEEISAVREWLFGKAGTIAGGSFEVQNNIIAKRILGLPELTTTAH